MYRILTLLALASLSSVTHAFDSVADERRWAMIGVNVIDVETGAMTADQAIIIRNGLIEAIENSTAVDLASVEIVVDMAGKYALPGLWDMHIHLRGGAELTDANERWLEQYLGYGITAVRETGGDIPQSVLRWKRGIEQGSVTGPRIYSALLKLDGPGARQSGAIPIGASSDIDAALGYLQSLGADFIKLYEMSYPPELFLETLRQAESPELRTAAHAPLYVPFRDMVDAGLDSVEHVFFIAKATNPNDSTLSAGMRRIEPYDSFAYLVEYSKMTTLVDESYARETFRKMASAGTAMVPTLAIERQIVDFLNGHVDKSPREQQTPLAIRESFDRSIEFMDANPDAARNAFLWPLKHAAPFIAVAAQEGVTILAGSDTGAGNPGVYPGDSLHQELQLLVEYGLSPLQAVQAATIGPAKWMRLEDRLGSVTAGKNADLVILSANPLDEITNTRSVFAVVQQGVYFDAAELDDLRRLTAN